MKSIEITALNKQGKAALKQHYEESKKLRLVHKIQMKAMGYKQTLMSTDPYKLRVLITNKYFQATLEPKKFKQQIYEALKSNGATKKDFKLEVE